MKENPSPRGKPALRPSLSPEVKEAFDISKAVRRLRTTVRTLPKAALFQLAEEGYQSVFELLVACILSIRTRDETTLPVSRRLFAKTRTPEAMLQLTAEEIDALIRDSTFHEAKARQIHEIARRTMAEYGGTLPGDEAVLLSLHGVGPKCTNLVLGIACGHAAIGVDIHVHRVTNRWGYVQAATPEKTMAALRESLPRRYWIEINALLVPFGKHVCTGAVPSCSTCPLLSMCQQVGVTKRR